LESLHVELSEKTAVLESRNAEVAGRIVGLQDEITLGSSKQAGFEKLAEYVSLEAYKALMGARNELLETLVKSRVSLPFYRNVSIDCVPQIDRMIEKEEAELEMRRLAPINWEKYQRCLHAGAASYEKLPSDSCSTEKHPQAKLFKAFLRPYLRGHILDIGCGPQPIPSYLAGYPLGLIHGIDPISEASKHPFDFVAGFGEFLPWADNSFDTVISGTTLDHYYLVDRGMREAFRVLRKGGHFVAWITEFADAPRYDPYEESVNPYDSEHMFHISRNWFMPMMEGIGFYEKEVILFNLPFNFLFMSFLKPSYENIDRPMVLEEVLSR
jgi:SAM-dependent methyltransferase